MSSYVDPLELEEIALPPIPGPISQTFFTDMPSDSPALFSTVSGTRPLRTLPHPIPVQAVRSGSHDDIKIKAHFLISNYPSIAESIVNPPATWQDLYRYFDAIDLWMEGAGFLFHVLGFLVRVNVTKINCIQRYVGQWAQLNAARLASMLPGEDILRCLNTPDDQAWFELDKMVPHEKKILTSVINWHYGMLWQNRNRLQTTRMPGQINGEDYRPHMNSLANPYQNSGKPGHNISHSPFRNIVQPTAAQRNLWDGQTRLGSDSYQRNGQFNHLDAKPRAFTNDIPVQGAAGGVVTIPAYRQSFGPNGMSEFANGTRRTSHSSHPIESFQRQLPDFQGPIYILDPQKIPAIHNGPITNAAGPNTSRTYSPPRFPHELQAHTTQNHRVDIDYIGNSIMFSNDARIQYQDGISRPRDGPLKPVRSWANNQNLDRPAWSRDGFCSVYVSGVGESDLTAEWVPGLLSQCGEIVHVNSVPSKYCLFITFKSPESALEAVTRFHNYPLENKKRLIVQPAKPYNRQNSFFPSDRNRENDRASSCTWTADKAVPSSQRNISLNSSDIVPQINKIGGPSQRIPPAVLPKKLQQSASNSRKAGSATESNFDARKRYPSVSQQAVEIVPRKEAETSGSFHSQLDSVESLIQTPGKLQQKTSLKDTTPVAREEKRGRSSQGFPNYGPKSGKNKKNAKTPKKPSRSPNSTPTHTPARKPTETSSGRRPAKVDGSGSLPVTVVTPCQGSKSASLTNLCRPLVLSAGSSMSQVQKSQISVSSCEITHTTTTTRQPSPSYESVSEQPVNSSATISSETAPSPDPDLGHELNISFDVLQGVTQSLAHSLEAPTSPDLTYKQIKSTQKGIKSDQALSRKTSNLTSAESVSQLVKDNSQFQGTGAVSEHVLIPDLKSDINTDVYHTASAHDILSNTEDTTLGARKKTKNKDPVATDTYPEGASTRRVTVQQQKQQHLRKKSTQSKSNDSDNNNLPNDERPIPLRNRRDSEGRDQEIFNHDESGGHSTAKPVHTVNKSRSHNRPESPIAPLKAQSKFKKKPSGVKVKTPDRKENDMPAPNLVLSDPVEWPALGSSKLQSDAKQNNLKKSSPIVKALHERAAPVAPVRRDSMASILSVSPKNVRRTEIDSLTSPVTGGSRLWPVVRRWDGQGPPDNNPDSETSVNAENEKQGK